jgi:hypothetical protein
MQAVSSDSGPQVISKIAAGGTEPFTAQVRLDFGFV